MNDPNATGFGTVDPWGATTPPTGIEGARKGGFWIRAAAVVIDGILLSIAFAILGAVLGVHGGISGTSGSASGLRTLVGIAYDVGLWTAWGTTIGGRLLGLRIVKTDGSKLSLGGAVLRYIGLLVSAFCFLLGVIWVAFDKNKQGWMDKIAGTYVIRS